jgi:hypothetical protein
LTFFNPPEPWVRWLITYAGGRPILDVGCGDGALLRALDASGYRKFLGVDPYASEDLFREMILRGIQVVCIEAETFSLTANPDVLPVICRPCHDGFVARVLAVRPRGAETLYVSKPSNLAVDVPRRRYNAMRLASAPACPEEWTYSVTPKPKYARRRGQPSGGTV